MKYTQEERKKAIELYIQYDKSIADTIHELGYPSRGMLYLWYESYLKEQETGIPHYGPKYSADQRQTALDYYLAHGRSIARTIRVLGYPGHDLLLNWIKEFAPNMHKHRKSVVHYSKEQKKAAVVDLCSSGKTPKEIAQDYGVGQNTLQSWKIALLGKKELPEMPDKTVSYSVSDRDKLVTEIESLKTQIDRLTLERDILEGTAEIIKKDPGIDPKDLSNREKTMLIDALRDAHKLQMLLSSLGIAKSSYFYQHSTLARPDKYAELRIRVREIFHNNESRYGYRRVKASLIREGAKVSEKVVLRLMNEDRLLVITKKYHKYNSYQGEITPAVENLLNRNFQADKPNQKWLTDITEFHIPAGKVYLSPVVDCFDGLAVSWTIGTSPDAGLVNDMLDLAAATISEGEYPVVHSDRGAHYRWPGWLSRMDEYGLLRSMSKKGCTPDNSACEGFFGRLKNEMFYHRSWKDVNIDEFIDVLDQYIHWYNDVRIKMSLGAMSPKEYRKSLGYMA